MPDARRHVRLALLLPLWLTCPGALRGDQPPDPAAGRRPGVGDGERTGTREDGTAPPTPSPGVTGARRARLAAEFRHQDALVIDGTELPRSWPGVFVDIVRAARGRVALVVIVDGLRDREGVRNLLDRHGLPLDGLRFLDVPHDTMWVRDFGPFLVERAGAGPGLVDMFYGEGDRRLDDEVPCGLGEAFGLPVQPVPLELDGGNLLTNGEGLCVTTTRVLERNRDAADERHVRRLLQRHCGCEEVVFLEPLAGEETGHVDMFATFTSPSTLVLGAYRPEDDPANAALLDRNARRLQGLSSGSGPLRVERIPMPARPDGVWRTYTNVVFLNGTMLVPVYPDVDAEQQFAALQLFTLLMPGWRLVGIDSEELSLHGGALRCVTLNLSALGRPGGPAAPALLRAPRVLPERPVDAQPGPVEWDEEAVLDLDGAGGGVVDEPEVTVEIGVNDIRP